MYKYDETDIVDRGHEVTQGEIFCVLYALQPRNNNLKNFNRIFWLSEGNLKI